MLIEFTVENFRSFREAQTLRMDAAYGADDHPENLIPVGHVPGMKGAHLLKVAAIYGPNASGKSNVVKAMAFVQKFVADSATGLNQGDPTGAEPFLLDPEYAKKPCRFEVRFIHEGVQYLYTLAIDQERVHEETLDAFPEGRPRSVFKRVLDENGRDRITVGSNYTKDIDAALTKRVRPNASLIGVGAQWNSEILSNVLWWFVMSIWLDDGATDESLLRNVTISALGESQEARETIEALLRGCDLGITKTQLEEEVVTAANRHILDQFPEVKEAQIGTTVRSPRVRRASMVHRSTSGVDLAFSLDQESEGTLRIFSLAGPMLATMNEGALFVVDELESSLHPQLAANLLKWFQEFQGAAPGAQLIFTTHDTSLMTLAKMRRDQFWFTEKHGDGATRLYPLTDYKPRKGESLSRGYLGGRYGAIPMVDDLPLVGKKRE